MGKLLEYKDLTGVHPGVIIWFIDHDRVFYVPISTFIYLVDNGEKSLNIKYANSDEYPMYELPSIKKRTFLETDYKGILNL